MNRLFSIIVPVYNVEQYLIECLDSIINQTYSNIEIIVVNDGSSDNSLQIIKQYQEKDHRILLIDQENQGLSCARNAGFAVATGDYVWFVDSDDYIDVLSCEYLDQRLSQIDSCVDIVSFGRYRYGDSWQSYDSVGDYDGTTSGDEYLTQSINNKTFYASSCNKIFCRDFLVANNILFLPKILYEDLLFVFRSIMSSHNIILLDKPLYYYRVVREGNITTMIKDRDVEVLITVQKLEESLNELNTNSYIKDVIFPRLVFSWVSNAICFKFPMKAPISTKANRILRQVMYSPIYYKYLHIIKRDKSVPFSWRLSCYLSIYCYPLFVFTIYVYGRLIRKKK